MDKVTKELRKETIHEHDHLCVVCSCLIPAGHPSWHGEDGIFPVCSRHIGQALPKQRNTGG